MPSGNTIGAAVGLAASPQTKELDRPKYLTISQAENGFVIMTNHTNDFEVDYHVGKDKKEIQDIIESYL